jgi:hypothetical protein
MGKFFRHNLVSLQRDWFHWGRVLSEYLIGYMYSKKRETAVTPSHYGPVTVVPKRVQNAAGFCLLPDLLQVHGRMACGQVTLVHQKGSGAHSGT